MAHPARRWLRPRRHSGGRRVPAEGRQLRWLAVDAIMPARPGSLRGLYPRASLGQAIKVTAAAAAIARETGVGMVDRRLLAERMGRSPASLAAELSAAAMFGLLDVARAAVRVRACGDRCTDPQHAAARCAAFLAVPLYEALFEQWVGRWMPPPAALARLLQQRGVPAKSCLLAAQTFLRSAADAGLLTDNRLHRYVEASAPEASAPGPGDVWAAQGRAVLEALWKMLPAEQFDTPTQRDLWWQAFVAVFEMAYSSAGADTADACSEDTAASEAPRLRAVAG